MTKVLAAERVGAFERGLGVEEGERVADGIGGGTIQREQIRRRRGVREIDLRVVK
jgi:hypothetical protein